MANSGKVGHFVFKSEGRTSTFKGEEFYELHKEDLFLQSLENIKQILAGSKALKLMVKINQSVEVENMETTEGETLVVYNGEYIGLTDSDYTVNRLQGMAAAYFCNNYEESFMGETLVVALASAHGIGFPEVGDKFDLNNLKCYISFTPGSHLFCDYLEFWPLAAAVYCANRDLIAGSEEHLKYFKSVLRSKDGQNRSMMELIKNQIQEVNKAFDALNKSDGITGQTMKELINLLFKKK